MAGNQGSTTCRNIPDVALTADDVFSYANNGQSGSIGGTSCAAPLWAGLMALANQQAVALGAAPVGFINPAVYATGCNTNYTQVFHDITTGDNTWDSSLGQFYAVTGYDLCTGWGTPSGQSLLDTLVGQPISALGSLDVISGSSFTASGLAGGPFDQTNFTVTLTNSGAMTVAWSLGNRMTNWLTVSPAAGSLDPQAMTNVNISLAGPATNLVPGIYSITLMFSNHATTAVRPVTVQLHVFSVFSASPAGTFEAIGPKGGPFFPASQDFTITNRTGVAQAWSISIANAPWLAASPTNGIAPAFGECAFTLNVTAKANALGVGIHKAVVALKNSTNHVIQNIPVVVKVGQNIVSNGGFETGNFKGWTLAAHDTAVGKISGLVHSGGYGADLGQTVTLGSLSQTLPTHAGQSYRLSVWVRNVLNSVGLFPNEFQIQWEGNTIFDQANFPFGAWSNLQFTVTATTSGSSLQFGFRDDPYFLGLDDITVKPIAVTNLSAVVSNPSKPVIRFKFNATPGTLYQVQYKTNLAQSEWINWSKPRTVDSDSFLLLETNALPDSQRFYRLVPVQ